MTIPAVKWIFWFAIAVAVAMCFAALSAAVDRNGALALIIGSGVLIVAAVLWYRRALPAAEAREEARQAEQLAALKQQINLTREPLAVRASSGVLVLVLFGSIAIYSAGKAFANPTAVSIGVLVFVALITGLLALVYVPRIGKPALTIRPDGLDVPVMDSFRWDEIESIGLRTYTTKGVTTHSIDLYVPQLRERAGRLHPLLRVAQRAFLRGGGGFVVINLINPSLPATLVHALCYDLWKERTGRSNTWSSVLSSQDIERMRRGDEQLEMLKSIGDSIEADPAAAMKRLDALKQRYGDLAAKEKSQKPLSPAAAKRRDALLADLRTVDPQDRLATQRMIEKHVETYARESVIEALLIIVAVAVLAAVGVVLFDG
jgi:hypothetical protein